MNLQEAKNLLGIKSPLTKKQVEEAYTRQLSSWSQVMNSALSRKEGDRAADTIASLKVAEEVCLKNLKQSAPKKVKTATPFSAPTYTSAVPQIAATYSYYKVPLNRFYRTIFTIQGFLHLVSVACRSGYRTIVGFVHIATAWMQVIWTFLCFPYHFLKGFIQGAFGIAKALWNATTSILPAGVVIAALIFGILTLGHMVGFAKQNFRTVSSNNTPAQSRPYQQAVIPAPRTEYSHLTLRSWPAARVRVDIRRRINSPSRAPLLVKPGERELRFVPTNPKLNTVVVNSTFSGGTRYEVLVNCENGSWKIREIE